MAVDLGARIRREVEAVIGRARRRAPGARWVLPEKLHLTLAFLGPVPDERLAVVVRAVEQGARGHAPFTLRVRGAGTFGGRARARVLWAGIDAPGLVELQAAIDGRLREAGFELEERPFKPHLTLARARERHGDPGLAAAADLMDDLDLGQVKVKEVEVVESHLSPKGARYEVRASVPL